MRRIFFLALGFLPVSFPAAHASSNLTRVQGEEVANLLKKADRLPLSKAWGIREQIQALDLPEDSMISKLEQASNLVGPHGKLVAAVLLRPLDGRQAVDLLISVLETGKTLAQRKAAADLLGDEDLPLRAQRKARRSLAKILSDDTQAPGLRLIAARSLYNIAGKAEEKLIARRTLLQFLKSRDRNNRIQGALALAEIGDLMTGGARALLEEIQEEPTPEGKRAKAWLEVERRNRRVEMLLRRLNEARIQGGGTSGTRDKRLALISELLDDIRKFHDDGLKLKTDRLLDKAAKGLMKASHPFSSYYTSDEYRRFAFELNRDYGGIGAYVNTDPQGNFKITRPIYSGPAYRAGLLSGDHITKVDGWSTADQPQEEIIRRLKGKPGTPVTITVWRPGWPKPKDITLNRAAIQVPSVNSELLPGGIAYVEILTFGLHTSQELARHLSNLVKRGAKGAVIDLRNNGGGYLEQARAVDSLFLPEGKLVVTTKGRIYRSEKLYTRTPRGSAHFPKLPLVVLVNAYTASASEIVSGSLQALKRAKIVGTQTYGKGSVQNLFPVRARPGEPFTDENNNRRWDEWESFKDLNGNKKYDPGARARITIARYYLPDGRCPDKRVDHDGKVLNKDYGVLPDRKVPLITQKIGDLWKNAVLSDLWTKRVFHKYVEKYLDSHKKEFMDLAVSDEGKTELYPDFDSFYKSLDTKLSKDDIRKWIRIVIREKVADLRGKSWPGGRLLGDFQEDNQLQAAIDTLLKEMGQDYKKIPQYAKVWKVKEEEKKTKDLKVGKK
ncbi:MAG TPA: PDZ domain-containing protein [Planctomycetes bacterium]|nr:PDZ domain-containing protein [Planctomycetota bacterium]